MKYNSNDFNNSLVKLTELKVVNTAKLFGGGVPLNNTTTGGPGSPSTAGNTNHSQKGKLNVVDASTTSI